MNKFNWTVFVSQTGSEVYDICNNIGAVPKLLVTNNPRKLRDDVAQFLKDNGCEMKCIPFRPTLEHYLQEDILDSSIITLHGYLRILPGEFIQRYSPKKIYNGHPGLITHYPELKGKDPQIRAWEGEYPYIGSVVHEVVEGVDEGEVIRFTMVANEETSLDGMYFRLKQTSLEAWLKFLKRRISELIF